MSHQSKNPEVRELQRLAGPDVCPFCLVALKRKRYGRHKSCCWSADCRTELMAAYQREHRLKKLSMERMSSAVMCNQTGATDE